MNIDRRDRGDNTRWWW